MSYIVHMAQTGCVIDGIHGVYTGELLCRYAEAHGWVPKFVWDKHSHDSDWLEDSAMDFLNDWVAMPGYSFGWFDGNVMYWSDADWEDM
jgi:hypothetical protein